MENINSVDNSIHGCVFSSDSGYLKYKKYVCELAFQVDVRFVRTRREIEEKFWKIMDFDRFSVTMNFPSEQKLV